MRFENWPGTRACTRFGAEHSRPHVRYRSKDGVRGRVGHDGTMEGGASTVCAGFRVRRLANRQIRRYKRARKRHRPSIAHRYLCELAANCRFQKTVIKVAIWTNYDGWTAFGDGIENGHFYRLSGYSVFFNENPKTFHAKNVCIDLTFIDIRQQVHMLPRLFLKMRRNVSAKEFPMKRCATCLVILASALFTSGVCQAGPISISVGSYTGDAQYDGTHFYSDLFEKAIGVWEGLLGNPTGKRFSLTITSVNFTPLVLGNGGSTSGAVADANVCWYCKLD